MISCSNQGKIIDWRDITKIFFFWDSSGEQKSQTGGRESLLICIPKLNMIKHHNLNKEIRVQNSSWLPTKTSSYYYLVSPVDIKMSEKSQNKTFFCKMIVLRSILKQLLTVFKVRLWRLICCVEGYNHSILLYFLILKTKSFVYGRNGLHAISKNLNVFAGLAKIFMGTKISLMVFKWSVLICSIETWINQFPCWPVYA